MTNDEKQKLFEKTVQQKIRQHINIARRYFCTQDAEDCVQDMYCRAVQNLNKFRHPYNMNGWLRDQLKKQIINSWRRDNNVKKRIKKSDLVELTGQQNNIVNDEDDIYILDDNKQNAIDGLSEKFQSVIVLAAKEMTYKEIANELKMKKGTVASRLHRCRKQLKTKLER